LNLPISLNYLVVKNLNLEAGVEFGYLLSAKVIGDITIDDTDQYKRFDMGAVLGVKYDLPYNFTIGLRYIHGVNSIVDMEYRDENGTDLSNKPKLQNRTYQLPLGYYFN